MLCENIDKAGLSGRNQDGGTAYSTNRVRTVFSTASYMLVFLLVVFCCLPIRAASTVHVTADDIRISASCRIIVPAGTVVEDENGDGVIHVVASNIEIEFAADSALRGAPGDCRPDQYKGFGIRINGQSDVTLRGARVSGFHGGIWATNADGLMLEAIDASDNRRAYLRSTPLAEDSGDWLFPHNNEDNEWLRNYGSAIYVEDSDGITIRDCTVRHGQNALCIDRVNDSKIYDNDFSFNSGWGIAMWRSNRNTITRNACDFCIRGYSHGVYNRGQDSAGILMFEQNNDNVIAENSATHGGDGFFGFAGREALGDASSRPVEWHRRRGNNDNLLIRNDFSYAAAHGIEMTFSFGNIFYDNRLVENAICGVWGGYSQDTLIAANRFQGNGQMAYGLERGGVNIEHGRANRIVDNAFRNNKCAVHLWWDPEGNFANKPWARANGTASKDNLVAFNTFAGDLVACQFRGPSEVLLGDNSFEDVGTEIQAEEAVVVKRIDDSAVAKIEKPAYSALGRTHPVGARKPLRGRSNIIMTAWGPWDHESPLIRLLRDKGNMVQYGLHRIPRRAKIVLSGEGVTGNIARADGADRPATYTVSAAQPGVHPYAVHVRSGDFQQDISGTLVSAAWDATFFKWTKETDPREDYSAWRSLAENDSAVRVGTGQLVLSYGWGGPSDQGLSSEVTNAKLGGDYFGMIATTRLPLSAGTWEFTTLSDDGVRVTVDGRLVIDNWTWHGPTRDVGTIELPTDKTVEIMVEHFEIDGYAVLELAVAKGD